MFKPATTWELKLGRVASFVFTGLFSWLLVSSFSRSQNNTWLEISFDYFCYSFGFLFYSSMIFFSFFKKDPVRDAKFYPVALLISIFAVNLVMFADFHASHIIDIFRLPLLFSRPVFLGASLLSADTNPGRAGQCQRR